MAGARQNALPSSTATVATRDKVIVRCADLERLHYPQVADAQIFFASCGRNRLHICTFFNTELMINN